MRRPGLGTIAVILATAVAGCSSATSGSASNSNANKAPVSVSTRGTTHTATGGNASAKPSAAQLAADHGKVCPILAASEVTAVIGALTDPPKAIHGTGDGCLYVNNSYSVQAVFQPSGVLDTTGLPAFQEGSPCKELTGSLVGGTTTAVADCTRTGVTMAVELQAVPPATISSKMAFQLSPLVQQLASATS